MADAAPAALFHTSQFYWLLAAFLLYAAWRNARERRWANAAFWALLVPLFAGGDAILAAHAAGNALPSQLAGCAVIALALCTLRMRRQPVPEAAPEQRAASARRLGHRLFVPALLIPAITVLVAVLGPLVPLPGHVLAGKSEATLVGLSLASVIAAFAAIVVTRQHAAHAPAEGRRLLDAMGWAALLPLLLAALGGVFAASGVGGEVAALVSMVIPVDSRVACVLAYGLGMVLFTVIMGNGFAAFPVMTAGIGLPLLIHRHGADAAALGALGMLTGYCGTLITPMAANFNLVPAALLELDDSNAVIRAQLPTALVLLAVNLVLMYLFAFRHGL